MNWLRLFIEPVDVWMFRDGRPFDAGFQHRAVSLFPPPPTVVQGALRSKHLSLMRGIGLHRPIEKDKKSPGSIEIGYSDQKYGAFRMVGPFVAKRDKNGRIWRYYPRPADAVNIRGACKPTAPRQIEGVETNLPQGLGLLWPPAPNLRADEHDPTEWWREDALRDYLELGKVSTTHVGIVPESDLIERESRVGIAYQGDTGTVVEGMLYEAEFTRPKDGVGIDVEIVELPTPWPPNGMLTLGGESRGARYHQLEEQAVRLPTTPNSDCFKIYLATPTYFGDGWRPKKGWTQFVGSEAELVGVALNRPLIVGGYDLAEQAHKSSQRFVPAGSVFYFKGQAFLSDTMTEWGTEIGLGHYFVGDWTC